ncbi:rubrerythrin [Massiliimalia massiliensis]|jgi:rubrerythrin|uniref:rubrerythrin n=1 Tax=Massiliimalia massiliensis TaxID=1852384 RepID=UPI000984E2BF|nr:rubrerythrin family protein [Massiliimalia massiliensis]
MELKGSKTEANLISAFAGESQAHTKYQYYSDQAKKDGFQQIGALFKETSDNEKAHAKIWFKLLHEGIPQTEENLKDGIAGENFEWTQMYAEYAKTAKEEGFDDIAFLFEQVGKIEKTHEERYQQLSNHVQNDKVFRKDGKAVWQCRVCGFQYEGEEAPEMCPVCKHLKAFFQILAENY